MKWFYRMSSFCFVNDNILSYSSLQAACFMIIILRAFELACSMQTTDVTNDNSNKTIQQALSPVLAVMLSDGVHFFTKLGGINCLIKTEVLLWYYLKLNHLPRRMF